MTDTDDDTEEFDWLEDDDESPDDEQQAGPGANTEGPLGDLADRVRDREVETTEELFVETEVSQVDRETVWEQLERDEPGGDEEIGHEPESRVVEKASYCETCEYFDEPPAMRCTHEGTEIRQLVDFEHVEVYNCPVVRRNDELEQS